MDQRKGVSYKISKKLKNPVVAGTLVFFSFIALGAFIFWQRYQILMEQRQSEMSGIIEMVEENIGQSLKSSYSAALSLALLIDDDGEIGDFENTAPRLIEANPILDAVELVPGGVITRVYPLEENSAALNYDILADSTRNEEARKAISSRKMYFAGPIKLRQGGTAVVGRLPVFIDNEFWGFSAVIIKLENLLRQAGLFGLTQDVYRFQFSKEDPLTGNEVYYLPGPVPDEAYSEYIILPDGDWKVYIAPKNPYRELASLWPLAAFIFILSLWMGWMMMRLLKRPHKLEELVEAQAGELYKSELKFRTIFNQAAVGIVRVDTGTGRILEVNRKFRELIGYSREELKNMDYRKLSHPDDIAENDLCMKKLLKGEIREYSLEKRSLRKDGSLAWIKLSVSPLWQPGEEPTSHISIIEDITEKKEAELQLNKSYQMVMDQNRRLLNFSYIISHDLRSHSSNIQSILDLYVISEKEEERRNYVELLKKVSVSLNQTLHHLNEVVSIQTNLDLKREPLKLIYFIEKTLDLLDMQIRSKNALVSLDVPPEAEVEFNPAYLESVILNFLSNALRYSDPERQPKVEVKAYKKDNNWVMEVRDNGIGIDLERNGSKLFGLYKTFSNRSDSRGIGLFITKNQVEAMGGEIQVESTPGKGTTFKVIFG
ncbi:sensor histidine kinase [Salegentibacter chungangensis]|uniref:histidine kinase n=1 Tax=Salegentibacter chungangensis TaxID=1335724 RepID=A0ABW3NL41_9FLAO